ncbi:hypothetical protein D7I39_21770 [Allopusillimonas ginsengisoli]|nr:hypothetical protein D7I39_21770 [Allopusillimonas ginsengisoli]
MASLHQHVAANKVGRDFIVGDLHGCLDLLQVELDHIGFDRAKDRLFSVGDLIDRGPDSMGCLRLLREPWFFAVRGNHEDMLLDYVYEVVMPYGIRTLANIFFRNGGGWVETLDADAQQELREDLLRRVVALPYVITVGEGETQFHVAHAELMTGSIDQSGFWSRLEGLPANQTRKRVLTDNEITENALAQMIEPLTWGRRLVGQVGKDNSKEVVVPEGMLLVSQQPLNLGLSLTYVGHTPVTSMILHESHLFIDRGAYARGNASCLLVLHHDEVCSWIA